jgi:hypothetical protein
MIGAATASLQTGHPDSRSSWRALVRLVGEFGLRCIVMFGINRVTGACIREPVTFAADTDWQWGCRIRKTCPRSGYCVPMPMLVVGKMVAAEYAFPRRCCEDALPCMTKHEHEYLPVPTV